MRPNRRFLRRFDDAVQVDRRLILSSACFVAAVIIATRLDILPGNARFLAPHPIVGSLLLGVGWCTIVLACGVLLWIPAVPAGDSARRILFRLLVAGILGTVLAGVVRQLGREAWDVLWYPKHFVGPLLALGLSVVFLHDEWLSSLRRFRATVPGWVVVQLSSLTVLCMLLVLGSDLILQRLLTDPAFLQQDSVLTKVQFLVNVMFLLTAVGLLYALSVSPRVIGTLITVSYGFFVWLDVEKLRHMHVPLLPTDFIYVREFLPLLQRYVKPLPLLAILGATGVVFRVFSHLFPMQDVRIPGRSRSAIALGSTAVLIVALLLNPTPCDWCGWEVVRGRGLLGGFIARIPTSFPKVPVNYSDSSVAVAQIRYAVSEADRVLDAPDLRPTVIIYLIESFMDPNDMGVRFSRDPIPELRALWNRGAGGYALVPGEFEGSANTEFEVLTGMNHEFVPARSSPFKQWIRNPTPSLARTFAANGYRTVAVQADPRWYYNRAKVYPLIGIDTTVWAREIPGVGEDRRGSGWPPDRALVEEVLRLAAESNPKFIFAFPTTTHSPYGLDSWEDSDLDVLDAPAGVDPQAVKDYVNGLRVSDRAVGLLIERLADRHAPTLVVVLGDHLPPLPGLVLSGIGTEGFSVEREWHRRRVPLVVWANFAVPNLRVQLSTNALPAFILQLLGWTPGGFIGFTAKVSAAMPIIRRYVQTRDGRVFREDSLPLPFADMLRDYRLLQYDILNGERFGAERWGLDDSGH